MTREVRAVRQTILNTLEEIERREGVRILLAVESGSRAWGFASPDSDYDVRFIYVRPEEEYLHLDRRRDVIERPVCVELDVNGWDLDKTLRLLHKSNPTVFEWFSSPIVYREDQNFCQRFRPMLQKYFSCKRGLYHYISMAEGNYRDYLRGETVRAKKYFYVLRPLLACRWILERETPPPMLFSELAETMLDPALVPEVDRLLALKRGAPEVREIPQCKELNRYLDEGIDQVKEKLSAFSREQAPDWDELNELFLSELKRDRG